MTAQKKPRPRGAGRKANQTTPSITPPGGMCPDCAAPLAGDQLRHQASCPTGAGLAQVNADDRQWFEDHPHAPYRIRPLALAEIAHLRAIGDLGDDQAATGRVAVVRIPGLGLLALPFDVVVTSRGGRR